MAIVRIDDHTTPVEFQQEHPERTGGGAMYVRIDPEGAGNAAACFQLRRQSHPFRGAKARGRIRDVYSAIPEEIRRRQKSGLSSDDHVEARHWAKDFSGSVLTSRHFLRSLVPPLGGPLPEELRAEA